MVFTWDTRSLRIRDEKYYKKTLIKRQVWLLISEKQNSKQKVLKGHREYISYWKNNLWKYLTVMNFYYLIMQFQNLSTKTDSFKEKFAIIVKIQHTSLNF